MLPRALAILGAVSAVFTTAADRDRTSRGSRTTDRPHGVGSNIGSLERATVLESYGRLPLSFERNEGQADPRVKYLSRGNGYTLFLTASEAALSLRGSNRAAPDPSPGRNLEGRSGGRTGVVWMTLVGGNPNAEISGVEELQGRSHYFIGTDPGHWRTNVPHYARVSYREVYPGVELAYHGNQERLEYDFVVSPGGDPALIRIHIEGPEAMWLDEDGSLILQMREGKLVQPAPFVYQEVQGARRRVGGNYVLRSARDVGFRVEAYDATRPLVIDPVLEYSTYLGGNSNDSGWAIAVDGSGSAYVTGSTDFSTDFPTVNPYQTDQGGLDLFVTKFSPSGSRLVYSTYLGGGDLDSGQGIAVDSSGSAYVTGYTESTDFPTLNPYQGDQVFADVFVTKLSPSGSSLEYSTYLGGSSTDYGGRIAVDGTGSAYVTGGTDSADFPTLNPYQTDEGNRDVFVTKLSPSGSGLEYSTYLGGSYFDSSFGLAVDTLGNAYVTGYTDSTNFPTVNPYQADRGASDVFVTKLSPSGSSVVYSTYLGGSNNEYGNGIAVDSAGSAYVTGHTSSTDFPTLNPYQPNQAGTDVFVTKLSPFGSTLAYSTYIGGSGFDRGLSIAVDGSGSAYVAGDTESADFPTLHPYHTLQGPSDALVVKLSPSGSSLVFSTYLGGSSYEMALGIAVDGAGSVYVTGYTASADFPTQNPFQTVQVPNDAFVSKLNPPTSFSFYTLTPCRVVDTRQAVNPLGGPALVCSVTPAPRTFPLGAACGIPSTARAISYNIAVTQPSSAGHLRLFPDGGLMSLTSSINYSAGMTRSNNGIATLGLGKLNVSCHQPSGTAQLIFDVNGYFE